ncbi:MAG TPA: cupin domain-containing protein [Noviherbaspirillum sp.]|nr:cupin domain-containing protein [Noviherbaspirillum sp.]
MRIQFGISREAFASEYFEQNYLLLRGALRDAAFSLADVDHLLHVTEPGHPLLRLHNGGFVAEEAYIEHYNDLGTQRRRIIRNNFYSLLKGGATLILNRVEQRQPLVRALCLEVAHFTSQHAIANGYLAFGHNASFGKHWDTHDVFAVQLHGRKRWQLFKPTLELPLSGQTSKDVKGECPADPVLDIILEAGDVLYIPRGWWHCATPIGEETFHVAIGVHPAFITDYIAWLCSYKLPQYLSCRHSLSFVHDNQERVRAAAQDVGAALASESNLQEYLSLIRNSDRVQSGFDLRTNVSGAMPVIEPGTVVRLNAIYPRDAHAQTPLVLNGRAIPLNELEQIVVAGLAQERMATVAQLQERSGAAQDSIHATLRKLLAKDLVQLMPAAG